MIALLHGILLGACLIFLRAAPTLAALATMALVTAVGMWWSSNTVSHNHLHNPVFRKRGLNRLLSLYLSIVLGVPQALWRSRHLAHHAGYQSPETPQRSPARPRARRARLSAQLLGELCVCALCCAIALWLAPTLIVLGYLPGYALGLGLCWLQGHFEHISRHTPAGLGGVSYYGRFYNRLWLNDGYHVEHHRFPREHWTRLPARRAQGAEESRLPPVVRCCESDSGSLNRLQARLLCGLERLALRAPWLQRWLVDVHARAFAALWPGLGEVASIAIVGGGLFPRSALALRRIAPHCRLVLIDADTNNLARAKAYLDAHGQASEIELCHARVERVADLPFDLIVVPLAFIGDRAALRHASGRSLLVHEWLFNRYGTASRCISPLLFKRLNLVRA